jgi:hypothetical protein
MPANPVIPTEDKTMRRITSMAALGLALLSLLMAVPSAWAQGQASATGPSAAPVQHWTVCWVQGNSIMTDRGARLTVYVSGLVPTVPPHDLDVGKAFGQFITNKFLPQGMHADSQCATMPSKAGAQAAVAPGADLDCSRWSIQCVMTDWTYTPDPNAAPVAAAPPPVNPCNIVVDHDLTKRPPGCVPTHVSYVVCSANDASLTAYISATFQVTALDNAGWTNGFAQLLAQKYSYKGGGVGCANIDETSAQTYAKNRAGALRTGGKMVVETDWTFGSSPVLPVVIPAAAAPPAPAPAPAAPTQPSTLYAVCWDRTGGINTSASFGVPFATTTRDIPVWTAAFKAFLNDKYGRASAGTISCNVSPTLDAAQQYEQKWRDLSSRNGKTIETGWSYGSSPAVSAASAAAAASTPAAPVVPSAQNTKYAVCWAEVPAHRTAYFSAPFTVAANFEAARTEYRKFLAEKYGQVGQFNCRVLSSLAEAQQQTQTWMNAARVKDTIVETGWKYE